MIINRVFYHIDEYGEPGVSYLTPLICLSDPLVLWSPAPLLLRRMNEREKSFLSPKDVLRFLDRADAPIRIILREKWLDQAWRNRTGGWPLGRWDEEFDPELVKMALEDKRRPLENRRVIVAPEEAGYEEAAKRLKRKFRIRQQLKELYQKQMLPVGILEKARRAEHSGTPVELQILRDAYNHNTAVREAGAKVAAVTDNYMGVLLTLASDAGVLTYDTPHDVKPVEPGELREALDLLRRIRPVSTYRQLNGFLRSGMRTELKDLLFSERATRSLEAHVANEIYKATKIKRLRDRLFPSKDPVGMTLSLGSLVSVVASILTHKFTFGIVPVAYVVSKGWLQAKSLVPLDVDANSKVKPLFQIACGTTRLTRDQVTEVLIRLRQPS